MEAYWRCLLAPSGEVRAPDQEGSDANSTNTPRQPPPLCRHPHQPEARAGSAAHRSLSPATRTTAAPSQGRPRPPEPATDALPRRTRRQARSARRHDRPHQPLAAPPLHAPAGLPTPSLSRHRHAQRHHHSAAPPRPGIARHPDPAASAHAKAAGRGNEEASPPPAPARLRPVAPSGGGEGRGGGGEGSWRRRGRVPPVASRGASGREGKAGRPQRICY